MASIIQMPSGKWRAQVRRAGHKPQCKTFTTKGAAQLWVKEIERAQDDGKPISKLGGMTVAQVIDAYIGMRAKARPIRPDSNEHYMLKMLRKYLGSKRVATLTVQDVVDYATARRDSDGAGPYTINMDISKLGTVFRYGGVALKQVLPDVVGAARPQLTYLRLIGPSTRRERRPVGDEFERILERMRERYRPVFAEATEFAARSAMRRGEVTALKWQDIDSSTRVATVLRKHPRKGKVSERVPLLDKTWKLLEKQPKGTPEDRVFPIAADTLSRYFKDARRELGIPDMRFHDLRHEGTSAMFEEGMDIPAVALVTGHKKWENLRRYTQLKPEDVARQPTRKAPSSPKAAARTSSKKAATSR